MDIEKNIPNDTIDELIIDKTALADDSRSEPNPQETATLLPVSESAVIDAGAGAGKTTTLAKKVSHLVCETDMKADRIAIMTFTRNAAAELRVRMNKTLSDAASSECSAEKKLHIREQIVRFKKAPVCTINSFCLEVLKENIQLFDLPANFAMIDDARSSMLFSQAINTAMEQFYSKEPCDDESKSFTDQERDTLFRLFSYKEDSNLRKALGYLHEKSVSIKDHIEWLKSCTVINDDIKDLIAFYEQNVIFKYFNKPIASISKKISTSGIKKYPHLIASLEADKKLITDFRDEVLDMYKNGADADKLTEFVNSELDNKLKYEALTPAGTTKAEQKEIDTVSKIRTENRTLIAKLPEILSSNSGSDQHSVIVGALVKLIILCDSEYQRLKAEQGYVDFHDCEQKLLDELRREGSPLRESLISKYDIIIIDEFQDTNSTQYAIFEQLTKDTSCSLFVVGDIKQSIYAFRGGDPSIMASLCEDEESFKHITLRNNYRSRSTVINSVNAVMGKLMTKQHGDIDYNDDVKLVCGNKNYDKIDDKLAEALRSNGNNTAVPATELDYYKSEMHVLTGSKDIDNNALEADFIGNRIKALVDNGFPVAGENAMDGEYRPCTYGDIGILVRKKKYIPRLKKALEAKGIPVYSIGDPFLEAEEILLALTYLRIIDNPMREKDLLTVLMSPLYCMDADKIASVKLGSIGFDLSKADIPDNDKDLLKKLFTTFTPLYTAVSAASRPFDTYKAANKNNEDYISAQQRINDLISAIFDENGCKKADAPDIKQLNTYEDSLIQFFIEYYKYNRNDDDCCIQLKKLRDFYIMLESKGAVREEGDKDCIRFIDDLKKLRFYKSNYSLERLARKLYDVTGLLSIINVLGDNDKRIANLHLLLKRIADFESAGNATLSDFLRYVDNAIKFKDTKTFEEASTNAVGNSVRIMTIHASKGLEMPIVFLSMLGESSDGGESTPYEFSSHYGIATKYLDNKNRKLNETAYYKALKAYNENKELSEELRLLYVAMTRAREKLIMSGVVSASTLGTNGSKITAGDTEAMLEKGAPIYWTLAALFPEGKGKIDSKGKPSDEILENADANIQICFHEKPESDKSAVSTDENADTADNRFNAKLVEHRDGLVLTLPQCTLPADINTAKKIAENICRTYSDKDLTTARSRYSVTEVAHMMEENDLSAVSAERVYISRPDFIDTDGFTGKEIGDAYHHAMEFLPFDTAPDKASDAIEDLLFHSHITEKEHSYLIKHSDKFAAFLRSELCKRALAASRISPDNLQKERAFFTQVSTAKLGLSTEEENKDVFLQGRIDMFFIEDDGVVLVDYKSDTLENLKKELDAYKKQLRMYNDVLFELTGKPVKEIYIYAFALDENKRTIKIEPKE